MFKKLIILAILLSVGIPVFAQSVDTAWVRRYNGGPGNSYDWANSIAVDGSGNVYVTGSANSSMTNYDYATIKYDPAGNQLWVEKYNGPGNSSDAANPIAVDDFGNVYVTGGSSNGTSMDYATIKYDSTGNQLWVERYDGPGNDFDWAYAIAVDGSGNVYVTGSSYGSGTGQDYATIKYDSAGNQLWIQRYNGLGNSSEHANAIAVDGSGNAYVTGSSYGSGTGQDYATIKYDPAGNQLWERRYNGPGNSTDAAIAIAVDGSGNVYVTGYSYGSGTSDDYTTIKYDSAGNQVWEKRYNGPGNSTDQAYAIAVDGSGNVYVTGESEGSVTDYDYATLKYDLAGNQVWEKRYNGPGDSTDRAYAIAVDDSGNVYVTGESEGSVTDYDYATIKYDPAGNQVWEKRYNGPGDTLDRASTIAVDASGNVYVTGGSYGSGTGQDYTTIKYFQFLCGDANGDDKITVSDVVYLINYLFKGGPKPEPIQCADVNGDCHVTVSDAVYLINYLFKGGPPPCS